MRHLPLTLLGIGSFLLLIGIPFYLFGLFGHPNLFIPTIVAIAVLVLLVSLGLAVCWQVGEGWAGHYHNFPRQNDGHLNTWLELAPVKLLDVRDKCRILILKN